MAKLDDHQITHLICVRLKHLLKDLFGRVLGLEKRKNNRKEAQNTAQKVNFANVLGGHGLDE